MWELDNKESGAPKKWCFWTVVLERILESLLDSKKIQPVRPKEDQSWVFIRRTDVEAETPILWPPDAMSWLIWKDRDAGKDWGQEAKGTTEDEMVVWHHWLNGHEFGWTRSWWWTGRSDMLRFMGSQRVGHDWATELNWTEGRFVLYLYKVEKMLFSILNTRGRPCFLLRHWKLTQSAGSQFNLFSTQVN